MPHTVPNSPMNGDAAAVVARNGRYFDSRAASMRDARNSERSTLSSERIIDVFACAICASISAYPALNKPTSDECEVCAVKAWTSASFFARRKANMNRRDAAADRRKRRAMTNITAHEPIENSSNTPRTAFPTHPVC